MRLVSSYSIPTSGSPSPEGCRGAPFPWGMYIGTQTRTGRTGADTLIQYCVNQQTEGGPLINDGSALLMARISNIPFLRPPGLLCVMAASVRVIDGPFSLCSGWHFGFWGMAGSLRAGLPAALEQNGGEGSRHDARLNSLGRPDTHKGGVLIPSWANRRRDGWIPG